MNLKSKLKIKFILECNKIKLNKIGIIRLQIKIGKKILLIDYNNVEKI